MAYNVVLTLPDAATALRIAKAICGQKGYAYTSDADAARFARQAVVDDWREMTINWEDSQRHAAAEADPNDPLNGPLMQQT